MNNIQNRGISLIVLVITIVIILILTTVSINMVIGEEGIINSAKKAKQEYDDAVLKEKGAIEIVSEKSENEIEIKNKIKAEEVYPEVAIEEWIPIYTKEQLAKVGTGSTEVINGKTYTLNADSKYKLMNNIDLDGAWTPLNRLRGIFCGQNYRINNIQITANSTKNIRTF